MNGRDYHFLDPAEFERLVEAGAFLEHASYSGHRYGTLRDEVERRLARGRAVLLEIEVQGARQIRGSMPEAVQVFIAPPDEPDIRRQLDDLRSRLEGRGLDDPAEIERRLEVALGELKARKEEFEGRGESSYVVVNDEIERAASELETIVRRELSLQSSEP